MQFCAFPACALHPVRLLLHRDINFSSMTGVWPLIDSRQPTRLAIRGRKGGWLPWPTCQVSKNRRLGVFMYRTPCLTNELISALHCKCSVIVALPSAVVAQQQANLQCHSASAVPLERWAAALRGDLRPCTAQVPSQCVLLSQRTGCSQSPADATPARNACSSGPEF